jgi:lipoprotein-anchoring transpeptidase ErfK/SrfK
VTHPQFYPVRLALRQRKNALARNLLHTDLASQPENAEGWLLLSRTASSTNAKRFYLLRAIQAEPGSATIRRELHLVIHQTRLAQHSATTEVTPKPTPRQMFWLGSTLLLLLVWLAIGFFRYPFPLNFTLATAAPIKNQLSAIEKNAEIGTAIAGQDWAELTGGAVSAVLKPALLALVTPYPSETALPTPTELAPAEVSAPVPLWYSSLPIALSQPGEHWIEVDLSEQKAYAWAGEQLQNSFVVSTGTWLTPTVIGTFRVYVKYVSQDMSGADYFLPGVPYVMYFYEGYALHGTFWHSNFGTPMSHGCVNFAPSDAEWLYNFADVGTQVYVHE